MSEKPVSPRILAIHAHPDDIEFQCAGTLALLKDRGCPITLITMTPGDCGSAELDSLEISRIRREEARRAAELLGADYICLEFRDLQITHDNDSRKRVTEAIRQVRPDLVLTAPPVDYMSDHEMTSRLVRDACFNASVPNYNTGAVNPAAALTKIPYLYYVDPLSGIDYFGKPIHPDFVIDVTQTYALKRDMLACHASQRNWLMTQHGIDEYLASCDRWSEVRGALLGVQHGEAFTQHRGHPYPHDNWLRELVLADAD